MDLIRYVKTRLAERRAQIQAAEKYRTLSEKALTELREGTKARHFQFVIVDVEETDTVAAQRVAAEVVDAIYEHDGVVTTTSLQILIGCLGLLMSEDSAEGRTKLVRYLLARYGPQLRIAHGECHGIAGYMGKRRYSYNVVIPGFHEIREKLSHIEFGTAFEVRDER